MGLLPLPFAPVLQRSLVAMAVYLADVYLVCVGMPIRRFVRVINADAALFLCSTMEAKAEEGEKLPISHWTEFSLLEIGFR